MTPPDLLTLPELLTEYERALGYTNDLWTDLSQEEVHWRPDDEASAIGWHLGHQPAVAHFMVRNLTAAEPPIDPILDRLMDSATVTPLRGDLPNLRRALDGDGLECALSCKPPTGSDRVVGGLRSADTDRL